MQSGPVLTDTQAGAGPDRRDGLAGGRTSERGGWKDAAPNAAAGIARRARRRLNCRGVSLNCRGAEWMWRVGAEVSSTASVS